MQTELKHFCLHITTTSNSTELVASYNFLFRKRIPVHLKKIPGNHLNPVRFLIVLKKCRESCWTFSLI